MFFRKRIFLALAVALVLTIASCSGIALQPTPSTASGTATPSASPETPAPAESPAPTQEAFTASPSPELSATKSAAVSPGASPSPTPADGTMSLAKVVLQDKTTWLNLRSQPDPTAVVLGCIPDGSEVAIAVQGEQWDKVVFEDGFAYAMASYLQIERPLASGEQTPVLQLMYAAPKPTKGYYPPKGSPGYTGKLLIDNLVDMRKYDSNIIYYMVFATEDNFMGKPMYPKKLCLLQKQVAEKLEKAEKLFEADGYRIKIYDAYRPMSVTKALYDKIKNSTFVANPNGFGSYHNRGCAVDMTLVDKNGNELEFQSKVHDLSSNAYVDNPNASATAKKNWNYMYGIMKKCGFESYKYEWWHFQDPGAARYLPTDYNFMKIPMVKGS